MASQLGCHFLEVVHRDKIEPNGDLAFESIGVGVLTGLRKIVLISHRSSNTLFLPAVALRADINRITASDSR